MIEQRIVLLGHDTASLGKSNLFFRETQRLVKASREDKSSFQNSYAKSGTDYPFLYCMVVKTSQFL
jgi:hypothetical protein